MEIIERKEPILNRQPSRNERVVKHLKEGEVLIFNSVKELRKHLASL